ncbi:MAG: ring-cleaving dioxygenase [Anaerolineae bacterium]|nr:ring-cleaving dioxygenase [Anaerolineae bacterium]
MQTIQGLHHITAIASDPQANIDFYHTILGQRLVKRTVNFDDPGTYHFYYADEIGTPGTVLTFFPWRHMKRGMKGNGEATAVSYNIPSPSLTYWQERLQKHTISLAERQTRFGQEVLAFSDPDGMTIELIANDDAATLQIWEDGPIPTQHALRGFHSVTTWVEQTRPTADLLVNQLGYQFVGQEGARTRFQGASNDVGLYIDLLERPGQPTGSMGAGSIHHIAFRTVDDEEQQEYLTKLRQQGYHVSPVMDRQYFHSIYFREPNGVLFEIATDAPGFLYDEPVSDLGMSLKLPAWLEKNRAEIEQAVPEIQIPQKIKSVSQSGKTGAKQ